MPASFWKKAGEHGFLCTWVEEKYDGSRANFAYLVVITEELEKIGAGLGGLGLHNDFVIPKILDYNI